MNDTALDLYKEIDDRLAESFLLMQSLGISRISDDLRYFAADVISRCYNGKYQKGLACACQCFLNSRIVHAEEQIDAGNVLIGDYFVAQVAGFDLPDDSSRMLEQFASFVEEEAADESFRPIDTNRFALLFQQVAEEMPE